MSFSWVASGLFLISTLIAGNALSDDTVVMLPKPKISGQVMKALGNRSSIKGFKAGELSDQTLSDILWAGFGIADKKTGKRTASTAFNARDIDIYVVRSDGVYRYDAELQAIRLIRAGDIRALLAGQNYVKSAPVHLLFVADYASARKVYPKSYETEMKNWALLHTGFIAENITLYCSVNRLSVVVRSVGNIETLTKELGLGVDQEILISQAIGHSPR